MFQNEPNPTRVVRARENWLYCNSASRGSLNSKFRLVHNHFLPEVFGEIRKTNNRRRLVLHYDNASSQTSAQTRDNLSTQNIELMGYPPYSPDLAPNNFFLFPFVKNKPRGQRFSSLKEAIEANL
ncbi:hypothetical protein GWI33_022867 [Rhynchophorus ferrugineus]|uniref:Transposase n=1 Tax=Rhynchophorus ferrugineus TaxID=354439 RepID=A0A834MHJ3_RHYFE|nr:hypothetical protein GWI33_022867 [Rhynchophorus ferrugineus]